MKATFAAVLIAVSTVAAPVTWAGASVPAPHIEAAAHSSTASTASTASSQAISIANFAYTPTPVTVSKGTVVTWTDNDPTTTHSVTSDTTDTTDPFDSSPTNCPVPGTGCIQPGATFTHTFNMIGTFTYHCRVHSFMSGTVTVTAPAVTVTSAAPNVLGQGASRSVTVHGSGFTSGATLSFSGTGVTAGATTLVDSATLTATVHVKSSALAGTRNVTVTDPSGGGSGTCTGCLTIDNRPVPAGATPSTVPRGVTNQGIVVTGSGFVSGATAKVPGSGVKVTNTAVVSSTKLRLTVTVASTAPTGPRSVKVTNPDGGTGSCAGCLTIS